MKNVAVEILPVCRREITTKVRAVGLSELAVAEEAASKPNRLGSALLSVGP